MPVSGTGSLAFETAIDNTQLIAGSNQAVSTIQNMATKIGKINPFAALAVVALAAFAAISKEAYQMAREFEHAMKEVETISKATQDNFDGISKSVFQISQISPDAPKALAEAYYQIVSAGYDGAAGLKLLEQSAKSAVAGVTSTETAADGLTTVMNAFNLSIDRAEEVSDTFFQTVKLGKTTMEQLAASVATVAPLASASGIAFQEIFAATASLTKQGVPTSQAMTQIRASIIALNENLGDGWSATMTFQEGLQALYDKAGGSQNNLKELVGRVESMNAILALAGKNLKNSKADLETYATVVGNTSAAFDTMIGDTQNQWKLFSNNLKNALRGLGNFWNEVSGSMATGMNELFANTSKTTSSIVAQSIAVDKLAAKMNDTKLPFDERIEALENLKRQYPEYLDFLDTDKIKEGNLEKELLKVRDAIKAINYEQDIRIGQTGREFIKAQYEISLGISKESQSEADAAIVREIERLEIVAKEAGKKFEYGTTDIETLENLKIALAGVTEQIKIQQTTGAGFLSQTNDDYVLREVGASIDNLINEYNRASGVVEDFQEKIEKIDASISSEYVRKLTKDLDAFKAKVDQINSIEKLAPFLDSDNVSGDAKAIANLRAQFIEFTTIIENLSESEVKNPKTVKAITDKYKSAFEVYRNEMNATIENARAQYKKSVAPDNTEKELAAKKKQYYAYTRAIKLGDTKLAETLKAQYGLNYKDYRSYLQRLYWATNDSMVERKNMILKQLEDEKSGPLAKNFGKTLDFVKPTIGFKVDIDFEELDAKDKRTAASIGEEIRKLIYLRDNKGEGTEGYEAYDALVKAKEQELAIFTAGAADIDAVMTDLTDRLKDLTVTQLQDVLAYWKKRKAAAKKGSQEEAYYQNKVVQVQTEKWLKITQDVEQNLLILEEAFSQFGDNVVSDILGALSGLSGGLQDIAIGLTAKSGSYESYTAAFNGVIKIIDTIASSSARRKAEEEAYYAAVIGYQKTYNLLLNEQQRIQKSASDNVFTTDFIHEFEQGISALNGASDSMAESLENLSEGKGKFDQANAIDWKAVGGTAAGGAAVGAVAGVAVSGAAAGIAAGLGSAILGATVGSVVPIVGTAIGLVVGGLIGIFASKKKKDLWGPVLDIYPELIDGQGEFNEKLAESLIEYDLVSEKTKDLLEDAIKWKAAIEEAREQIAGVISDLAGGLGDELRTVLVDTFVNGGNAAEEFGVTVSNVLEQILEQLIFDQIFSDQFKKLQEEMTASYDIGGDRSWIDDFGRFAEGSAAMIPAWNQAMEDAQAAGQEYGFDFWNDQADRDRQTLSGGIKAITEDTASILAGYLNAMRIDLRNSLETNESSLKALVLIGENTSYNKHLESMDDKLTNIETALT